MLKFWAFFFNPFRWPSRLLILSFFFFLLNFLFPLPAEKPYSQIIFAADGTTVLQISLAADDRWRIRTIPADVSPELIAALIAKEDRWFYNHPGFNPFSLARAFFHNTFTGRRTSGASTITMQVARLAEPRPRTYISKFVEIFRAMQYEFHHTKEEILTMYLSYLPYGGNVEGVRAASMIYFQRPAKKLSLSQCILLTVIPNRPNSLRMDKYPDRALAVRNMWIEKFKRDHVFPSSDLDISMEEPVIAKRMAPQTFAPHFCQVVSKTREETEIRTTLDFSIQADAERLLANHVRRVKSKGVGNGAVIVVNNSDRSVIAYCGSSDFANTPDQGQVNGITSVRSPGSALKPAVYGMGFDKGLITPKYVYNDVPSDFGGYTPENYDLIFHGPVSVEFALRHSLNIPAVACLNESGLQDFTALLQQAGFSSIGNQRKKLGLSLILGGCGVTLEEMTNLYSAFACKGMWYPLRYTTEEEKPGDEGQLFSESASFLLAEILSGLERPDIPNDMLDAARKSRIAWKTGTSYGRRDAWAIGFNPRFTVGVWMGNFDGTGAPDLSGSTMAVPLLFDVFNAVDKGEQNWFTEPAAIRERKVCAETGLLPGDLCSHKVTDSYIHRQSHENKCALDREIFLNRDSTMQYCTACLPGKGYIRAVYPLFDPGLMHWMENSGMKYPRPPRHNPDCSAASQGDGPKIISPSVEYEYLVRDEAGQEILLQGLSPADVVRQYWYIGGNFFRSCEPGEKVFYRPLAGKTEVVCMDDRGRTASVTVSVLRY